MTRMAAALTKGVLPAALLLGATRVQAESWQPSWRGFYAGAQVVSPLRSPEPTTDAVGLTALALLGLTEHVTLNLQLIVPATVPDQPLYRVGVDWRLF